jgi:hypothetical protein
MEYQSDTNYQKSFDYNKDIFASELFLEIRNHFTTVISRSFSGDIFPQNKKRTRVFHNMFSQWFFWESYQKKFEEYPLLIQPPFTHQTFYQVLNDYVKNQENSNSNNLNIEKEIENFIKELNLEEKFTQALIKVQNFEEVLNYHQNVKEINKNLIIKGKYNKYFVRFPFNLFNQMKKVIGLEKTIALIFRYYVLSSNNNQLAVHPEVMKNLKANIELFASGFNHYFNKFGSVFPDLEKDLGSIGRFQDLTLISGNYQINPPFQVTIIYDILKKIKIWMEKANENNHDLSFEIFIPNWDKTDKNYSQYQVKELLSLIPAKIEINDKNCEEFSYYDYWKETERKILPNSYVIKISRNY